MSALTTVGSIWPITLEGNTPAPLPLAPSKHEHMFVCQFTTLVCFVCGESNAVITARREAERQRELKDARIRTSAGYTSNIMQAGSFDDYAEEEHTGHRSPFTGAWFCDTCNSPYCDLA